MENNSNENNLQKALKNLVKKNPFDQYIREVETTHIPVEFIQHVTIQYKDGSIVELDGGDVLADVEVNRGSKTPMKDVNNEKIADVRVFVDTIKLQKSIDDKIDELFNRHNIL